MISLVLLLQTSAIAASFCRRHRRTNFSPTVAIRDGPNVLNAWTLSMIVFLRNGRFNRGGMSTTRVNWDSKLFCPNCKHRFDTEALDWTAPVGCWYDSALLPTWNARNVPRRTHSQNGLVHRLVSATWHSNFMNGSSRKNSWITYPNCSSIR